MLIKKVEPKKEKILICVKSKNEPVKQKPINHKPSFKLPNIKIPPKMVSLFILTILLFGGSVFGVIAGITSLSKKETTISVSNATAFSSSVNIPASLSLVAGDYKSYIANFTAFTEIERPFYFNLTINGTGLVDNTLKIRILNGTSGTVLNESSIASGNTISILRNVNIKNGDVMGFNISVEANTSGFINGSAYTLTTEIYPLPFGFK